MTDLTEPRHGRAAFEYANSAAREVVDAVRTTLGPKGMNKMLVDANGSIAITNDGVTILQEMAIDDPIGKLLLGVAEAQVREAGDGTTTAILLTGELLAQADELLERGVHPSRIVRGYRLAAELLDRELDQLATSFEVGDTEVYRRIATTCLNGRDFGGVPVDDAVDLVVDAIDRVTVDGRIDLDAIGTRRQANRSASASRLVPGTVLDRDPPRPDMPTAFDDAAVLVLSRRLGPEPINDTKASADNVMNEVTDKYRFEVTDPRQLAGFDQREREELHEKARRIVDLGVDAVFAPLTIDDRIADHLGRHGVLAMPASTHDLEYLATTTGATVVPTPADATPAVLGRGRVVRDHRDGLTYVEGDDAPRVTLLLRGNSEELLAEFWRCVHNATEAIGRAADDPRVVAGGGAIEAELARRLRIYADRVPGREQLAIEATAGALDAVPRTLARSAGINEVDAAIQLRNRHAGGDLDAGIDVETGAVADMVDAGVIEPVMVKAIALTTAIDAACTIVRVDGILPVDHPFTYEDSDDDAVSPSDEEE